MKAGSRFRAAFTIGVAVCFFSAMPMSAGAAAGDLDPTFGNGGTVTTEFAFGGFGEAVALQSDGKIVAAGSCSVGIPFLADFCLARYNTDGSLDTSFDGDGRVTTSIGSFDATHAVAVQGDGKIVAAGHCFVGTIPDFCFARYNPDGSLDTSFDGDGKVTTHMSIGLLGSDIAHAVALQGDGKIVATGLCWLLGFPLFCVARYKTDGSLDTAFDGDGKVRTAVGGTSDSASAVTVQGDGKSVVAGGCEIGVSRVFCLARYNNDGSLDTSFGTGGKVTTAIAAGAGAGAVALQGDGKLVAAGTCLVGSTGDFCLARYKPDGSLDTSFGTGGKVTTAIGAGSDSAHAVALQGDGKIVAAGDCEIGSTRQFCLARYNADGSLDTSFGTGGKVTTAVGTRSELNDAGVQADGKIVAAGFCSDSYFCLARYDGGPTANQPPQATDDDVSGTEDTELTIAKATLLANDSDGGDGGPLSLTAVSSATGGTVEISGTNVIFHPSANLCGENAASFVYTISDGTDMDTGTVRIDLACVAQLADVITGLELIMSTAGPAMVDKLEDALAKLQAADDKLDAGDRQGALGELEGAVGDLEAAVEDFPVISVGVTDLMQEIVAVARSYGEGAIGEAEARGGDPVKIAHGRRSLAGGDLERDDGQFKDAVARYKDAVATAEGA